MTRAEMADGLLRVADGDSLDREHTEIVAAAAAELHKTCATCRWFQPKLTAGVCELTEITVLTDGSGFCHCHEAKP